MQLKHLAEFQDILTDYHISESIQRVLKQIQLVLLIGPTASGRNTIISQLLKTGEYYFIVADTTREPRVNDGRLEQNGVAYWFRSEEEILKDLQGGKFLEAAIVHSQSVYGTSMRELEAARGQQKTAIADVEIVGTHNIMQAKPDTTAIFVLPPNFNEWQRRIRKRGAMNQEELVRRLESAQKEFVAALEHTYYHFVINDTLKNSVSHIESIIRAGKNDASSQRQGRALVEQLLKQTSERLNELRKGPYSH